MKRHKRKQRARRPAATTAVPMPIQVAAKIHGINQRQTAISGRLGKLGAETARLHAEFNGNELCRAELLREFDTVAKP